MWENQIFLLKAVEKQNELHLLRFGLRFASCSSSSIIILYEDYSSDKMSEVMMKIFLSKSKKWFFSFHAILAGQRKVGAPWKGNKIQSYKVGKSFIFQLFNNKTFCKKKF